jgi:hypothetical protein
MAFLALVPPFFGWASFSKLIALLQLAERSAFLPTALEVGTGNNGSMTKHIAAWCEGRGRALTLTN